MGQARCFSIDELLQKCAVKAGEWTCSSSKALKDVMCQHDDALVRLSEHAISQIEAHGDTAIANGEQILEEVGPDSVSESMLDLIMRAKAFYDEAYEIKAFDGQRAPTELQMQGGERICFQNVQDYARQNEVN